MTFPFGCWRARKVRALLGHVRWPDATTRVPLQPGQPLEVDGAVFKVALQQLAARQEGCSANGDPSCHALNLSARGTGPPACRRLFKRTLDASQSVQGAREVDVRRKSASPSSQGPLVPTPAKSH